MTGYYQITVTIHKRNSCMLVCKLIYQTGNIGKLVWIWVKEASSGRPIWLPPLIRTAIWMIERKLVMCAYSMAENLLSYHLITKLHHILGIYVMKCLILSTWMRMEGIIKKILQILHLFIYPIICLKSVCLSGDVRTMQFVFLAQSPREMSQTDRIHPRYFLLRVRVSIRPRYFVNAKKP